MSSVLYTIPRIVSSGPPVRMPNVVHHRSDCLIKEQLQVVKSSQDVFRKSIERLRTIENERLAAAFQEALDDQKAKLSEMVLIAQVVDKIRKELVYARAELKATLKANMNIYGARKRVAWLENQLEHLIREQCPKTLTCINVHELLTPSPPPYESPAREPSPEPEPCPEVDKRRESEDAYNEMRSALVRMESNLMSKEELRGTWDKYKERRETPKVEVDYNLMLENTMLDLMDDDDYDDADAKNDLLELGIDLEELVGRKLMPKTVEERSEVSEAVIEESPAPATSDTPKPDTSTPDIRTSTLDIDTSTPVIDTHTPASASPDALREKEFTTEFADLNPEESDQPTTAEKVTDHDSRSRQSTRPSLADDVIDEFARQSDEEVNDELAADDLGKQYWQSEHHRFHYSEHANALLEADPLSYHQMGVALPGTFIKSASTTSPLLPWRQLPSGEIRDVHRVALDKLKLRVQNMYQAIYDAAMTSVDSPQNASPNEVNSLQTLQSKTEIGRTSTGAVSRDPNREAPKTLLFPPIKRRTAPRVAMVFHSKPVPTATPLPVSKLNLHQTYPRAPEDLAHLQESSPRREKPQRLVNQRNLYDECKLSIYKPVKRKTSDDQKFNLHIPDLMAEEERLNERQTTLRRSNGGTRMTSRLGTGVEPSLSILSHENSGAEVVLTPGQLLNDPTGLKSQRLMGLTNTNLKSSRVADRAEAATQLGLLDSSEVTVVSALEEALMHDENAVVRYECAKALTTLGHVTDDVLALLVRYLVRGNMQVQLDVLHTLIEGRNVHLIDRNLVNYEHLVKTLNVLVADAHARSVVSFNAAVCLGQLCVPSYLARNKLKYILVDHLADHHMKAEALVTLVRQMNCRDSDVVDAIFTQLKSSRDWRHRAEAGRLLIVLGADVVCADDRAPKASLPIISNLVTVDHAARCAVTKGKPPGQWEHVYGLLEARLWDEPRLAVRRIVARVMAALGMANKACERMEKNLEDADEAVRAQAVISVGTLGLKKKAVVKTLLEMVELDSSEYVRLQVIKTFGLLNLSDRKIVRSLKERAKTGGLLGAEAIKVLHQIGHGVDS